MSEGDPYRTDDLSELRSLLRGTMGRLADTVNAMPPSKLERLAKALAYFDGDGPEPWPHPLQVLQALGDIAPELPTALAIECSPMLTLEGDGPDGSAVYDLGNKVSGGLYLLAKALRIETDNAAPHDIEFWLENVQTCMTLIERCSITEFRKMTSFEGGCFNATQPLMAHFCGPAGARVRIIVRSERQPIISLYPGGVGASPVRPSLCPRCRRYRGVPGGCTCTTAVGPHVG